MNRSFITRSVTAFGLLGLVSTAAVADVKSFPGLNCYQLSGGIFARNNGTVYNNSSASELTVQCPIVRDNPGQTFGAAQISFDVFDRHSTIDASCSFCNEIGTASGLSNSCGVPAVSTGIDQTAVHNMAVPTNPTNLGSTEYSYVNCTLPRSESGAVSHLARIWMNEP